MLTDIIGVGAIDDGFEAALRGNLGEPTPQFSFAVVATVGGIAEIPGILQLARLHLENWNVEALREL
jgi:hypothetical protein